MLADRTARVSALGNSDFEVPKKAGQSSRGHLETESLDWKSIQLDQGDTRCRVTLASH